MNNGIEMFIYFYKYLGYLGIYPGLTYFEYRSRKLREDEIFVRTVHDTGVCHGPVPVVENELYLRKYQYLLKSTCFVAVDSLNCYIITSVNVLGNIHPDGLKY